jgi:hypothetical protein
VIPFGECLAGYLVPTVATPPTVFSVDGSNSVGKDLALARTKSCDGAAAMAHIVWATPMCGKRRTYRPPLCFFVSVRCIEGMWQIVWARNWCGSHYIT